MTYKSALAEMPFGGGKAVILGDPARDKTRALLAAYARVVDALGGRFNTGCDMGMDERDMAVLSRLTRHIQHAPTGQRLDTADLAALGVFESIRAAAAVLGRGLEGLRVAVQGLGTSASTSPAAWPRPASSSRWPTWIRARAERAVDELHALAVDPAAIYDVEADVFSPNAAAAS
jgi:leucine dehydrogenase